MTAAPTRKAPAAGGLFEVAEVRALGGGLHWLELEAPEAARTAQAGQFAHILCGAAPGEGDVPGGAWGNLRRAFGLADVDPDRGRVAIQFRAAGERSRWLAGLGAGDAVDALMPLGRGYRLAAGRALVLVAEPSRPAALVPGVRQWLRETRSDGRAGGGGALTTVIVAGAESGAPVAAERLRGLGVEPEFVAPAAALMRVASLLDGAPERPWLVCASGTHPFLAALAGVCLERDVELQVAMEALMTCGIGVCLSCTVPGPRGDGFYRRCCVEGPVFDAREVAW